MVESMEMQHSIHAWTCMEGVTPIVLDLALTTGTELSIVPQSFSTFKKRHLVPTLSKIPHHGGWVGMWWMFQFYRMFGTSLLLLMQYSFMFAVQGMMDTQVYVTITTCKYNDISMGGWLGDVVAFILHFLYVAFIIQHTSHWVVGWEMWWTIVTYVQTYTKHVHIAMQYTSHLGGWMGDVVDYIFDKITQPYTMGREKG